jgi:hypothetical protein
MLAIGNGAQQEILDQIKLVGVNNIVIKPIIEQKEEKVEEQVGKKEKKKFSPGLTVRDVKSIESTIPGLTRISPEIILETNVIRKGYRRSAKLVGVEPAYFEIYNFDLQEGQMFNDTGMRDRSIHQITVLSYGESGGEEYQGRAALAHHRGRAERTRGFAEQHQQARHPRLQYGRVHAAADDADPLPEPGPDHGGRVADGGHAQQRHELRQQQREYAAHQRSGTEELSSIGPAGHPGE